MSYASNPSHFCCCNTPRRRSGARLVFPRSSVLRCLLGVALGLFALAAAVAESASHPIVAENRLPGTGDWVLTRPANDREQQIKGYASKTSVAHGESLGFRVSVSPPQDFRIRVYRLGWYGGAGGRFMLDSGPLPGVTQPALVVDETTGLATAPWSTDYSLTIPADWVTGVYAAKLINAEGFDNYVIFVVRDDQRDADLLFQRSVTTDQAYNNYPDDGRIGKSLYDFNSHGDDTVAGSPRAVKVSFDRPYAGSGAGTFFEWEFPLLRWLERAGYDLSYTTNIDTHGQAARLLDFAGFLSTGHDEYWSREMRDAVEAARAGGVNLAFFGANAAYYQIRFEPSSDGTADRVMTVYKNGEIDPIGDPSLKTVRWRKIPGQAEQQLIGVQYRSYGPWDENADYVVANSDHWIYRDTGFADGDRVPGIVGYEVDSFQPAYPAPVGVGQTVLSASAYLDANGDSVIANSSIYQAPSGAWVFAAGTMSWSWALDEPGYIDPRIQQTTSNLLDAFIGDAPPDGSPAEPPICGAGSGDAARLNASSPGDRVVYEDAEDGTTAGWRVYADVGTVTNLFDTERGNCVIALDGNGTATGYRLRNPDGSLWQDRERGLLSLDLAYRESFAFYVDIDTSGGKRYLYYTPTGQGNDWTWDIYLHHGLDGALTDGRWQRVERDLRADLRSAAPGLELLEVNGIVMRGSGRVDDIALGRTLPPPENGRVYEDAEDGATLGWRVYSGAGRIDNLFDSQRGSRVIALQGNGTDTGYRLGNPDGTLWRDGERSLLSFDLEYSEAFALYVDVETNDGKRYLYYTPTGQGNDWAWDIYTHHGLDSTLTDGRWQRIERDLLADLRAAEPGLDLLRVDGFLIRGSGRLDNIELR